MTQIKKYFQSFGMVFLRLLVVFCMTFLATKYGFSADDPFAPSREGVRVATDSDSTVQWYLTIGAAIWCIYKAVGEWSVKQAAGTFVGIVILIFVINMLVFN